MTTFNGPLPPPKQIRFVANHQGQPPSKRRRINAACLTCRKRKTRCSGDRPACATCSKNGHRCLGYGDPEEKRRDYPAPAAGLKREPSVSTGVVFTELDDECLKEEADDEEWDDHERHANWKPVDQLGLATKTGYQHANSTNRSMATKFQSNERAELHSYQGHRKQRQSSRSLPPIPPEEVTRVPYFRLFGPTAIVPGYKQILAPVPNISRSDRRQSRGCGSSPTTSPRGRTTSQVAGFATGPPQPARQASPAARSLDRMPIYEQNDSSTDPLIISLIKTFFARLGCNYPFLRPDKFLQMVREKRAEPILVDAVCALAARFHDFPLPAGSRNSHARTDYGQHFAQKARAATVETFTCPTVGAVQAFLLLAYDSFGQDQDSALWMYLGLAIRMAVDLGLPKKVGVKYQGEKDPWYTRTWNNGKSIDSSGCKSEQAVGDGDERGSGRGQEGDAHGSRQEQDEDLSPDQQERVDTFWAVFVLDRVISSGTGRPVTLRNGDFDFTVPETELAPTASRADPFPTFLHIIHLYGRVSDVVNNIWNDKDLTSKKLTELGEMENELMELFKAQDQTLHFNAVNFRGFVKAGQGTTFILLHFWFHALIIILHQPTLLFGLHGHTHQLLANSRELSLSSAKTIADILSFAEMIEDESFIGNPFTSQPIYIAACAFLMHLYALSAESSSPEPAAPDESRDPSGPPSGSAEPPRQPKHSLLAVGATQNYQRCYKSLQQLQSHWGGVRYILTVLDQKSTGTWDCETYTAEELRSLRRQPPRFEIPASPNAPPVAFSVTGTTNSDSSSLTLLYPSAAAVQAGTSSASSIPQSSSTSSHPSSGYSTSTIPAATSGPSDSCSSSVPVSAPTPPGNMIYDPIRPSSEMYHREGMSRDLGLDAGGWMAKDIYPSSPYPQANESALRCSAAQPPQPKMHSLPESPSSRSMPKHESPSAADDVSTRPLTPNVDTKLHIFGDLVHHDHGDPQHQHAHPPPPPSYSPSSHSPTVYEPSIVPPDSSPSSTIADPPSLQHHSFPHGYHGSSALGSGDGGHDQGDASYCAGGCGGDDGGRSYTPSSSSFPLAAGIGPEESVILHAPIGINFGSQQFNIGGIDPWLEMAPNELMNYFDINNFGASSGAHMS